VAVRRVGAPSTDSTVRPGGLRAERADHPASGGSGQEAGVQLPVVRAVHFTLLGAAANPFAPPFDYRPLRLGKKVAAGARFVQTQLIYNLERFKTYMARVRDLGLHERVYILAGVGSLKSVGAARSMADKAGGSGGNMLVKDQMTPHPVCGRPEMPVTEAQALMQEHSIRHLPILDADGALVGLITQRALTQAVPSDVKKFSPFVINYVLAKIKARNIMVKDVITIGEDMAIEEAARIMADRKIGCLPVMRDGELVGIISDNDLFNAMVNLLGARRAGLRVTVLQPDRAGEVARISTAIAEKGGYLSGFVTYPTADPSIWASLFKVTNVPKEKLIETLNNLPDIRVQDVRDV